MKPTSELIERAFEVSYRHGIYFTRSVFVPENDLLMRVLSLEPAKNKSKALAIIDEGVARAFPQLIGQIAAYFSQEACPSRLVIPPLVRPGGEAAKNSRQLADDLYARIEQHGICRHSYILAIGGGAFLDAVGFVAATAHRGVRLIRFPTTTLAQADGGVGVKNGLNAFGKKNFIGSFAPPFAVINDVEFLEHLPAPEKRAGLIEAIKVALIRDSGFFEEIERSADALARCEVDALERVIWRCAELHVDHIAGSGDAFEFGSARPLDFGHWSAHKLEQISGFRISHGAAVALGVALDTLYSFRLGILSSAETERVLSLIQKIGFAIYDPLMAPAVVGGTGELLDGLEEFREHLGGDLTITLLAGIGRGVEVQKIDEGLMQASILELARRSGFAA